MLEKKARNVVILDMRGLASYTDVFVICSASNRRQVQAIASFLRTEGKEVLGRLPNSIEGMEAARWVLVDFGDAVVHVFDESLRGFYDLDGLWSDAPRMPVPEVEVEDDDDEEDEDEPNFFTL